MNENETTGKNKSHKLNYESYSAVEGFVVPVLLFAEKE